MIRGRSSVGRPLTNDSGITQLTSPQEDSCFEAIFQIVLFLLLPSSSYHSFLGLEFWRGWGWGCMGGVWDRGRGWISLNSTPTVMTLNFALFSVDRQGSGTDSMTLCQSQMPF